MYVAIIELEPTINPLKNLEAKNLLPLDIVNVALPLSSCWIMSSAHINRCSILFTTSGENALPLPRLASFSAWSCMMSTRLPAVGGLSDRHRVKVRMMWPPKRRLVTAQREPHTWAAHLQTQTLCLNECTKEWTKEPAARWTRCRRRPSRCLCRYRTAGSAHSIMKTSLISQSNLSHIHTYIHTYTPRCSWTPGESYASSS